MKSFISLARIPGSKRSHISLWDHILHYYPYQVIYEPYGGGLTVSNYLIQNATVQKVVGAEIDPSLLGLYEAWYQPINRQCILDELQRWQSYPIESVIKALKVAYVREWNERNSSAIKHIPTHKDQGIFIGPIVTENVRPMDLSYAAVHGILLRWLAFNGKLAPNATNTELNISISKQQAKRWGEFSYKFPKSPRDLIVCSDARDIDWTLHDDLSSLAIIDPPYCGSIKKMKYRDHDYIRPVYFGHKPHNIETLYLATDPVAQALANGVTVVIACNYYTDRLNNAYKLLASEYGYRVFSADGVESKLNNGRSGKTPFYKDTYWVFHNSTHSFGDNYD